MSAQRKNLSQAIEYLISGGVYFWAGYGLFAILWSGLGWSLWWATIISNVFGWCINFALQRYWVFKNSNLNGHNSEITWRYTLITLVDFGLNYLILYGLRKIGISPYIGQFVSAGFFTIWNYAWYRYWVFPEKLRGVKTYITPARVIAHRAHGHIAYHRVVH